MDNPGYVGAEPVLCEKDWCTNRPNSSVPFGIPKRGIIIVESDCRLTLEDTSSNRYSNYRFHPRATQRKHVSKSPSRRAVSCLLSNAIDAKADTDC